MPHHHSITHASLAQDIVTALVDLDEKLKLADVTDFADLADRLRSLGRSEFLHLMSFASIAFGLAPLEPVTSEVEEKSKE